MQGAKKKSFFAAVVCLILCVVLLAGTTFAWFSDSVSNTGNRIQAGTLDIELVTEGQTVLPAADEDGNPLLWEPGFSWKAAGNITNAGSLWLKYTASISDVEITDGGIGAAVDIASVIDVYAGENAEDMTDANRLGTLRQLIDSGHTSWTGVLAPKGSSGTVEGENVTDTAPLNLIFKMQESAGNDYQNDCITFSVKVDAIQYSYEQDGFGSSLYDANANGTPDHPEFNNITAEIEKNVKTENSLVKEETVIGTSGVSAVIPAGAKTESTGSDITMTLVVEPTAQPEDITLASNEKAYNYEVHIDGLADDNTSVIPVSIQMSRNLMYMRAFHTIGGTAYELTKGTSGAGYGTFVYDSSTGIMTIYCTDFSPYTFAYTVPGTVSVSDPEEVRTALENCEPGTVIDFAAGTYDFEGQELTIDKNIVFSGNNADALNMKIKITGGSEFKMTDMNITGDSYVLSSMASVIDIENCEVDVDATQRLSGRSAYVYTGLTESSSGLNLILKNNSIAIASSADGYAAAVFGWQYIDGAEITGNTFASDTKPVKFIAVKMMNHVDGSEVVFDSNTVYADSSSYGVYVFDMYQNCSRANAYTATFTNNNVILTGSTAGNDEYLIDLEANSGSFGPGHATIIVGSGNVFNGTPVTSTSNHVLIEQSDAGQVIYK